MSLWERTRTWWAKSVYDNPVAAKELRTRMRGGKAFLVMGAYVLFLAITMLIAYAVLWASSGYDAYGMRSLVNQRVGFQLLAWQIRVQTVLLSLFVPALACGALSREEESKTIELLALSRVSAGRIVFGKLLSSFLYSLMLLVCSLPLAGMCIMFGGISPGEAARAYLQLAIWAFLLSSAGIFWSALFGRTLTAALFTYGTSGLYLLVTSIFGGQVIVPRLMGYGGGDSELAVAGLSPLWATDFALITANICGVRLLLTSAAGLLHFLGAVLMLFVACMHVKHKPSEKAVPIRLLLLAGSVVLFWVTMGDRVTWSGPTTPKDQVLMFAIFLTVAMVLLGIAVSIFATGPARKKQGDSLVRYALSPRRVFRSDLGGGILFMMLWAVVIACTAGVTTVWALREFHIASNPQVFHSFIRLSVVVVTVVTALSVTGVLLSSLTRRRRDAIALMMLLLVLVFGGYGMVLAVYDNGVSNPNNPIWQLAAFWPIMPAYTEANGWGRYMPPLLWPQSKGWLVVSIVYAVVAAGALGIASVVSAKLPGIREE